MRRFLVLALALVCGCPLLAHADALSSTFLFVEILAAVVGVGLLGMVMSALAYWRPSSRALAIGSYGLNGVGLLLGLLWEQVFRRENGTGLAVLDDFNPFLALSLPLAVWLLAANKVAFRRHPQASMWGVALALAGASFFLNEVLFWAMRGLLAESFYPVFSAVYWQWLVAPAVLFGIWWVVLRQARRAQPLGWPRRAIWLVPVQALLLSAAWSYLPLLPDLPSLIPDPRWLPRLFGHALQTLGVGALAIWLSQRQSRQAA